MLSCLYIYIYYLKKYNFNRGSRGDRETMFYEKTLKEIPDFARFAPKYHGIEELQFPHEIHQHPHSIYKLF